MVDHSSRFSASKCVLEMLAYRLFHVQSWLGIFGVANNISIFDSLGKYKKGLTTVWNMVPKTDNFGNYLLNSLDL